MFPSKILFVAGLSLAVTSVARAQCPDGTPPPCGGGDTRRAVPLALVPKRVNPPLNDNTYIVLPFNNVTRASDTEWLSDASVNLLSMDLSRWRDIQVIDDRRVADFMRELSAPAGGKLSFNDAVTVARRAGAGKLVIGDVLKVGNRMVITATLFNVRDGKQIRTARGEAIVADSLMPLFGKLARQILAVPATDANVGSVGTSRADAYQAYVAGTQALNRFDGPTAKKHLEQAIRLDTGFALAHYKWAIAALYDEKAGAARQAQLKVAEMNNMANAMEDRERIAHAQAAARLASKLPVREQKLIAGLVALVTYDFPRACEAYASLVRTDSSDVEALYGYGSCLFADDMVEPIVPGDTTRWRFRTSWNTALRVFRRAALVDPTFHLAFDPILTILTAPGRMGCARKDLLETCADTAITARYLAAMERDGDSLVTIPRGGFRTRLDIIVPASAFTPPRANIEAARVDAADWVAVGPTEGRAKKHLARLLLRLGRPAEAELQVKEAMTDPAMSGDQELFMMRFEIAVKLFRGQEVNRLLDTVTRIIPGEIGIAAFAGLAPVAGRVRSLDSLYVATFAKLASQPPAAVVQLLGQVTRITAGVSGDTIAALERQAFAAMSRPGQPCGTGCMRLLSPGFVLALRTPRGWPAFSDAAAAERRILPALALAKGDTTALRVAAVVLDSVSKNIARLGLQEDGSSAVAIDAFLILGDSASALKTARRMADTTLTTTTTDGLLGIGSAPNVSLWPRAILVRADLEAAMKAGDKAIAQDLYAKFLDLWSKADPEFAPLLARIRTAQAELVKKAP